MDDGVRSLASIDMFLVWESQTLCDSCMLQSRTQLQEFSRTLARIPELWVGVKGLKQVKMRSDSTSWYIMTTAPRRPLLMMRPLHWNTEAISTCFIEPQPGANSCSLCQETPSTPEEKEAMQSRAGSSDSICASPSTLQALSP